MVTIERVLSLPVFKGSVWGAGRGGRDRPVRYVDIAEVPDIRFWVSPDVFFLTTAYALHGEDTAFMDFLRSLVRNEAAGLGVKLGRFLDRLPEEFYRYAEENDFPIILLPSGLRYTYAIRAVMEAVLTEERAGSSFGTVLNDYFEEMLFGDFSMRSLLRFEQMGFSLDMKIRVILSASLDAKADFVSPALRALMGEGSILATVFTSSVTIFLMSCTSDSPEAFAGVLPLLSGKVRVAVGGLHRLGDFRRSYEEARWVLGLFGLLSVDRGIHTFEDMELFVPLLQSNDSEGAHRSAKLLLAPLLEYDARNNAELMDTLHAFVRCDRSHKETPKALHLHRNTLRYRLAKIESLLPPGSFGGFSFLRLSLALLIYFSNRH